MNKHLKAFFYRGLIFGGFGPIIGGIVFLSIQLSGVSLNLNGYESFIAIISLYLLAFVQAGASVFNQIEDWPIAKSTGIHFLSIYLVYLLCYLLNSWIPFDWLVIAIFSAIFLVGYAIIWITVYFVVKKTSKKLNRALKQ